ncbi:MAG: hypothetical protein FJ091_00410 [Deltaproteobacteria bacterium]|nr:hypothetical protein [Deltaproteobacteria bacterium]
MNALTFVDQDDVLFMLGGTERRLREVQAATRAQLGAEPPAGEPQP